GLAFHDPEGGAPDDGGGLGVGRAPVRQLTRAPRELDAAAEPADQRRGLDVHGALAVDELRIGRARPPAVGVDVVLLPGGTLADVLAAELLVGAEPHVEAVEPV